MWYRECSCCTREFTYECVEYGFCVKCGCEDYIWVHLDFDDDESEE